MGREMPYRIYLPDAYDNDDRTYPVLYLLHGLFGSFENWTELGGIEAAVAGRDLIVVMPEGEDGWYCNGINADDRYEHYITGELIEHCDKAYRTKNTKLFRAVAGNSMGGYGAVKFAIKFPQLFDFAYSSSGAFAVTDWNEESQPPQWQEYKASVTRIYGNKNCRIRAENDIFELAKIADKINLPEIYFDCGIDDKFLEVNTTLADSFKKLGVSCNFQKISGGHDWEFWSNRAKHIIEIADRRLCKGIKDRLV